MSDQIARLNAALEGRYAISRQIGEGGMATVYLATDLRHEREVALKVLKPDLAAVVGGDRFLAEIKTTANLKHPHILPLFDSGQADSFLFYVMPYVEGESLRDRINRDKQLPVDEAVAIARKVAGALQHAHDHGVIHRDVKPGNILFQDNEPVVTDFGIALAAGVAGGTRLTETGLSVGTPFYMSPEQATGDQGMGPASDTYSLACVLYEMLIGDPPYQGSTAQAVLGQIIAGDPVSATKKRASIPANVDAAIRKALEKLPADRFTSAHEFGKALADPAFRHGEEAAAGVAVGTGIWKPWALFATGLALVSTVGFGWSLLRPAPLEDAVARFQVQPPAGVEIIGALGLDVSPDGRTIVFVDERGQLYRREIGQLEAVPIPNAENAFNPFFSPDGEWIGYFGLGDATLKKIRLDGGGGQTLAPAPGAIRSGAWGSDGNIVMWSNVWPDLRRVRDTGGEVEPIEDTEGPELRWLEALPGGRAVLASTLDEIVAVSLDTGERTALISGVRPQYASTGHLLFWRQGDVWAVRFDAERLEVTGDPALVVEGVMALSNDLAWFAVGGDVLFYQTGIQTNLTSGQLVFVDRNGVESPLGIETPAARFPRVSPDGGRLMAAVGETVEGANNVDLWVFDLTRGSRSRITFGGNNSFTPVWTPIGDQVTYSDGIVPPNTLFLAAADGSGRIDTLLVREGLQYPMSWSPEGRRLAYYENHPETLRDIWVLPMGGEPEPFLITPYQERFPEFSPDGRWLAYLSDESGRDEVYVQPYPGPGPEYTVSTGGGREPSWSPDGSELFYRTEDAFMVVPVQLGDDFRADTPRPLFEDTYFFGNAGIRNYDVTPDGQRFVMVRNAVSFTPGVVVLNLSELLQAQVRD